MKRIIIVIMLAAAACLTSEAYAAPGVNFSIGAGFFYSSLSPYGDWFQSDFGYAWRPLHMAAGWRPYMYGRWVWTDYGWYWVSSEPFGWATFHYGRWQYDDYYGWIWIPDDTWGPAWVEWRYDDDYIGWAPLPPMATFSFSIGLTFRDSWMAPVHYWNFVPCRYFTSTHIYENVQPVERVRRIFGNTRLADNIRAQDNRVVNRGVDINFVSRRSGTPVRRMEVVESERSRGERIVRDSNRERLEVYRPRIENEARKGQAVQPNAAPRTPDRGRLGRSDTPPGQQGREVQRTPMAPRREVPATRGQNVQPERRQEQQRETLIQRQREQMRLEQDRMRLQQEQQRQNQSRARVQPSPQQPTERMRQREAPKIERQAAPPPRIQERQQPRQIERPRPAQRPPESRGGRDGARKR